MTTSAPSSLAPMDDGALTDAPGCKGRSGDELENESGSFTSDESDDGMDDAATAAEAAAVDEAVDTLFVSAIQATVAHMVNPAILPSQHVPAPVAAAVVEMLTANMQERAALYVARANARAKAAHKREGSRQRMQKTRMRRKRDAGVVGGGGAVT